DLNCDLGEGAGHDAELMPLISSANIACGAHAGDEATMRATVKLALKHGVLIGAHPGFPDRENFGRKELAASAHEIHGWVLAQTQRLLGIAGDCGARVRHVKPHGALYNLAARDAGVAQAVAEAVYEADPRLLLIGLAGSRLIDAGATCGLNTMNEVFADRTYQPDGSLTPRARPDAVIRDEAAAVAQVLRMIREGRVIATDGSEVEIKPDTICLHGDGPRAMAFAQAVNMALRAANVTIRA
ncbi:MAG TPA: 5-oxoprolinase subunit PxpA, partial [Lacunisphaera sp.]